MKIGPLDILLYPPGMEPPKYLEPSPTEARVDAYIGSYTIGAFSPLCYGSSTGAAPVIIGPYTAMSTMWVPRKDPIIEIVRESLPKELVKDAVTIITAGEEQ